MSTTTFMNLVLPVPTVTLGPEWATEVVEAFETIDIHDHSSGKGVKITPAGFNINTNLTFANYAATNLGYAEFDNLSAALEGALYSNLISVVNGDLYFTNNSGVAVQITDGGAIISTPSSASIFEYTEIVTDTTIGPSETYVFVSIDTSAERTITLPLASSVSAGRIYILKDSSGTSDQYPLTIELQGSDTIDNESELIISSPDASIGVISDGVSAWKVF